MQNIAYKYLPINEEKNLRRTLEILNGKIYFSSPANFNDPFELSAKIDVTSAPSLQFMKRSKQRTIISNYRRKSPEALSENWKKNIGILCLTENPLDILMWSHYSSNHTGVCIGFDTTYEPFADAKPVIYSTERPRVGFNTPPEDLVTQTLLTKSKNWKYEKETRVIKRTISEHELEYFNQRFKKEPHLLEEIAETIANHGGSGVYQFQPEAIASIHFGAKISVTNKQKIFEHLKKMEFKIKAFQVELDKDHYRLNIKTTRY